MNQSGEALRNQGFDGDALERRFRPIKDLAVSKLYGLLPLLEELKGKTQDVQVKIDVDTLLGQISALKKGVNDLATTAENAFVSGFGPLLNSIVSRSETAWQAIKKFTLNIVTAVNNVIAKKLGEKLAESIFPKGGAGADGGGIYSKFFAWLFPSAATPDHASQLASGVIPLATGGPVRGPGGPTEDKVPAALSNGEWVINARRVKQLGPKFLSWVNGGTGFLPPQPAFLSAANVSPVARIESSGFGVSRAERSSGSSSFNMTVVTKDAQSFRRSEGQIAARARLAVENGRRNQ